MSGPPGLAPAATRADIPAMPPIALTDAQLAAVMRAAEPLAPGDRSAFLETVAGLLQGQAIGDGAVHRACADAPTKTRLPEFRQLRIREVRRTLPR